MAEHAASIGVNVIVSILTEYAKRIIDRAVKGEKLSDWEIGFLLMEATRMTLEARMESIEKRIDLIERRMDMLEKRIGEVERNMIMRIELLEKGVEGLESDMKQMRASIDSLRDLIINKLVEALAKKP